MKTRTSKSGVLVFYVNKNAHKSLNTTMVNSIE